MSSKLCPKCERVVSINGVPSFCAWGCGSLENQPILPDYSKWEERQKVINELKAKWKTPVAIVEEIKPMRMQLKLF